MIDSKTLMINNWVYWNKEPYQIDIDHFKLYLVFEPIPLSLDILEKCGFRMNDDREYIMDISEDDELEYSFAFEQFILNGMFIPTKKLYLHQLQNLYFCLSGGELKISL